MDGFRLRTSQQTTGRNYSMVTAAALSDSEWASFLASAKPVSGAGPSRASIALVGEAPGVNETVYGRPFVGEAGNELTRIMAEAGLDRKTMYATNLFKIKPPDTDRAKNDITAFFVSRSHMDADFSLPAFGPGKYVRRPMGDHVRETFRELNMVGAKLVVALGGTALWGLLGKSKISQYLGTLHPPDNGRTWSVIPTYHPSAILRQYSLRTTSIANFRKIANTLRTVETGSQAGERLLRPTYKITINPTLDMVESFAARACKAPEIAVDVETMFGQIRTISFTITANHAFVIPFWEPPAPPYWPTLDGELRAWRAVKRIMESPGTKIGQNILYDLQYLWRVHGIKVRGRIEDTMAYAHAAEPELPRSLGFLAATYLQMPEWKTMRIKTEKDEE